MPQIDIYTKQQIDSKYGTSVDTTPTENSTNLVTSGGVYNAINSGGSGVSAHTYSNFGQLVTDYLAHQDAICVIKSYGSYAKTVAFSTNRIDFHFYNFSFNQNTNFTFWYQTFDANTTSTATSLSGTSFKGMVYPTSLSYNSYSGSLNIEDITLYY